MCKRLKNPYASAKSSVELKKFQWLTKRQFTTHAANVWPTLFSKSTMGKSSALVSLVLSCNQMDYAGKVIPTKL